MQWLGWTNYLWVWLAVHHLGFAWRDDRLGGVGKRLLFSAVGFVSLWLLIFKGPYPLAMVGSPDPGLSNTLPPKITLLALGAFQFGLLLALESPMRRALDGLRLWTATVLINSMIMTVYLWHITVMVIFGAVLYKLRRVSDSDMSPVRSTGGTRGQCGLLLCSYCCCPWHCCCRRWSEEGGLPTHPYRGRHGKSRAR